MRRTLQLLTLCLAAAACGWGDDSEDWPPTGVDHGRWFLIGRQSPDGSWRSETYGALKDGWSLTPPVLKTLLFSGSEIPADLQIGRALGFLASPIWSAGTIETLPGEMPYPVYTSALAAIALERSRREELREARDAWLTLLSSHQLTEELGWSPDDLAYGGWGYSLEPPRKQDAAGRLYDSDLSSTLFALGALRYCGASFDDPRVAKALVFVRRCQNWPAPGAERDPAFDDGGFFFTPTNDLQNKAGVAGTDARGRVRYHSYGAMTADGVRALLRCGLPRDDPAVVAARRWLEEHFTVATNPGVFEEEREIERDASYYYWCWSLAHALTELGLDVVETGDGPVRWAPALTEELLGRQRPDGSWANRFSLVKEDDPLIATSFACAALELARLRSAARSHGLR